MKIRFDNLLLGTLWIIAVTLGASFWFNTLFGFDIFSAKHWEYVSYLQAAKTPIVSTFYVSFVITIFIAILGLYVLIRPRLRKFRLPILRISSSNEKKFEQVEKTNKDASTLDVVQKSEYQTAPAATVQHQQYTPVRPPRLNLPISNNIASAINTTQQKSNFSKQENPANKDYPEIQEIFKSAGYTVKKNTIINGNKTALLAIGSNEVLWIGAVGIKTTDMRAMIDKLARIFSDTLDDIYININGFVISALDAGTSEFQDILMFNSVDELKSYMENKKNPPLAEDDDGNFEAYSEYIDTVINYIGKI